MPLRLLALLVLCAMVGGPAQAQPSQLVVFDEDDAPGDGYREASFGEATGGDTLSLAGPLGNRMPVADVAFRGMTSGQVAYRHDAGAWHLAIQPETGDLDLTPYDSLVFFLNGPSPVFEAELPRLALEDADAARTADLALDLEGRLGFSAARSGFDAGSATDAALAVRYVDALPPGLARPGYPEDLLLTFADAPVDTSAAGIGVPAVPAHFTVTTAATGERLRFRFFDTDGDGTLSQTDEYVEILTPEAFGSDRLRTTWQVTLTSAPVTPPGAGDVFRLAVDSGGLDGDERTWQRVALAFSDFGPLAGFDLERVAAVRLSNGDAPNTRLQTVWVDYVVAVAGEEGGAAPEPPTTITAQAGDRSVVLRWTPAEGAAGTLVYRQDDPGEPFRLLTDPFASTPDFADVDVDNGKAYTYVLRSVGAGDAVSADAAPVVVTPQAGLEDAFLGLLAEKAFAYFWNEANPANGLVKDRSTSTSPASIAAVGFGLSALTVGIDRGWITREEGRARTLATLGFFWNSPQSTAADATGYKGFYYHFLDMQTGRRAWNSELSTIDTALLLGGVLHARQYFDGEGEGETRIRALADSIYQRVDWTWAAPRAPLVALGWRPESGFIGFDWRGYNEAMILYLLALGSPTRPLPAEAWDAWTSTYRWETHYGRSFVVFPPLFGHQYSHVWVDFRGIQDAYMRQQGIDYFENSRRATLSQQAYAADNPARWEGYSATTWGLTASDVPTGYRARGAPPAQNDDGTITPTAPGGSVPFAPKATIATLRDLYRTYRGRLWGRYGFKDAINPEENWVARDVLGIDQGPILLMVENYLTERVWTSFMSHEAVQRGLARAGFQAVDVRAEPAEDPRRLSLTAFPNPFRRVAHLEYEVPTPGPVEVAVYDALGRQVAVLVDAAHPAGQHRVALDAHAWAAGLYLVRLKTGKSMRTQSLVRLR